MPGSHEKLHTIWGGSLLAHIKENCVSIYRPGDDRPFKVLRGEVDVTHLLEIPQRLGENTLLVLESGASVSLRRWDVSGGWYTTLKGPPKESVEGVLYVPDFGGALIYGGDIYGGDGEAIFFPDFHDEGMRLQGPKKRINGAVFVEDLGGLVTYGDSGEVFLFKDADQEGKRLQGPKEHIAGALFVKELGGLVTYGFAGEVVLFKDADQGGKRLQGAEKLIAGALFVKELGGLVTYGQANEVVLFKDADQGGKRLQGAENDIAGALFVKELGGLVTYGSCGEVVLFKDADQEGKRLQGPENFIAGALFVKELGGLVTYGDSGEVVLFKDADQEGKRLQGPENFIVGALFVKELGGLVTYGFAGEVVLFKDADQEGKRLQGAEKDIAGALFVKEFGGLVTYGEFASEVVLFKDADQEGKRLQGPGYHIAGALFVKELGGPVTYRRANEVVLFKDADQGGKRLQGAETDIAGALFVKELGGLVTYSDYGEVVLFKDADQEGKRLQGPEYGIAGALFVKELGGLVTYGHAGEVFLFKDADQGGKRLQGAERSIAGALFVKELGGLVTYGHEGEVVLFKDADQGGKCLQGAKYDIAGALFVKELGGLVTYGHFLNEMVLFKDADQEGKRLQGPENKIAGAIFVKKLGGLVTYGASGEVCLFKQSKQERLGMETITGRIWGALDTETWGLVVFGADGAFTIIENSGFTAARIPLQIHDGVDKVVEVGKNLVLLFRDSIYVEIVLHKATKSATTPTMLVEHIANVCGIFEIDQQCLLTCTRIADASGMQVLFVSQLDQGFLGVGKYTKQGSSLSRCDKIKAFADRNPLLIAKLSYWVEMASNAYSFLVLASFAAEGPGLPQIQVPLQWLEKLQDLPWLSEYMPDKVVLLWVEVWSAAGMTSIVLAVFYLQQWLMRYALVRPGAASQEGIADILGIGIQFVMKPLFVPLLKCLMFGVLGIEPSAALSNIGQSVSRIASLTAVATLILWNRRMVQIDFISKYTSGWGRAPWDGKADKGLTTLDRHSKRRHPLSHASIYLEMDKFNAKTCLTLIAVLNGHFKIMPMIAAFANFAVGGMLLKAAWTKQDYYTIDANTITLVAAAGVQATYVGKVAASLAVQFEFVKYDDDNNCSDSTLQFCTILTICDAVLIFAAVLTVLVFRNVTWFRRFRDMFTNYFKTIKCRKDDPTDINGRFDRLGLRLHAIDSRITALEREYSVPLLM